MTTQSASTEPAAIPATSAQQSPEPRHLSLWLRGTAFCPGPGPDRPWRRLHELLETTDHQVLGSPRTDHCYRLRRRGMAECQGQSGANALGLDASAALARIW